jgi:Arc/MetJ family transcription regulator
LQSTADFAILQRLEISYLMVKNMQVIEQLNIEDSLFAEIATRAEKLHKSKNDVVNELLRKALRKESVEEKERKHRESYEKFPVEEDEFYVDEEQLIEAWKDL